MDEVLASLGGMRASLVAIAQEIVSQFIAGLGADVVSSNTSYHWYVQVLGYWAISYEIHTTASSNICMCIRIRRIASMPRF